MRPHNYNKQSCGKNSRHFWFLSNPLLSPTKLKIEANQNNQTFDQLIKSDCSLSGLSLNKRTGSASGHWQVAASGRLKFMASSFHVYWIFIWDAKQSRSKAEADCFSINAWYELARSYKKISNGKCRTYVNQRRNSRYRYVNNGGKWNIM